MSSTAVSAALYSQSLFSLSASVSISSASGNQTSSLGSAATKKLPDAPAALLDLTSSRSAAAAKASLASLSTVPDGSSVSGDSTSADGASDSDTIDPKLLLIASLVEQSGGDKEEFLKRMKKVQAFASGQAGDQAAVRSVKASGELSLTQAQAAIASANGSSATVAAAYSASLKGSFQEEIQLEDGTKVNVDVSFEMSVTAAAAAKLQKQSDPLALDLNGDGKISAVDAGQGAAFDINADGQLDQSGFVSGDDVFLALDRNQNGRIDDGSELFGDQNGAANGFDELAKYDSNGDGKIDQSDPVFGSLSGVRLGANRQLEQYSLAQLNVSAIFLKYRSASEAGDGGSTVAQKGAFQTADGKTGLAADLLVNRSPVDGVA